MQELRGVKRAVFCYFYLPIVSTTVILIALNPFLYVAFRGIRLFLIESVYDNYLFFYNSASLYIHAL